MAQGTSAWYFELSVDQGCGNVAKGAGHKTQSIQGEKMRREVHNSRQCLLKVCSNDYFFYGTVILVLQYF